MKTNNTRRRISLALMASLAASPSFTAAEDIDLFVGSSASGIASRPNVLIVIDNSANWSAANQHWAGGVKQGQSELRALRRVSAQLSERVNLGLMLFTPGSGSNIDGAYVRYAMRPMTPTNKAALQELIGDGNCVDGPNSLNGTPNCIFKNYDSASEKVGTAKTDYSSALFEAFKYFGGYTSPALAKRDIAGTPIGPDHFGPLRRSGDPDPKSDPGAFNPDTQRLTYNPPIDANNSCAKNYIIFIGNGFPSSDAPASLLTGVGGNSSQIPMPQFNTTNTTETAIIGSACGTGNNTSQRLTNCTANIPDSLKDLFPADSYACTGSGVIDAAACPGTNNMKFSVQSTKTVITVTPTGAYNLPTSRDIRYADEWAKYLYTTDVSAALGQQNVRTYTIDVFKDAPDARQTALLFNMAKVGGGDYFQASSEAAIEDALKKILIEIQSENSVFAAAALPVSATNRAQNENQVFFGLFRPDSDGSPRWYGNLKRYQVARTGAGELILADKNGSNAVAASGFFSACSASFWTSDTGDYWSFSPTATGECTLASTSLHSDLPDGPLVEKGGAAGVLRTGNNPSAPHTFALNRTMYTCSGTGACPSGTTSGMVPFSTDNVSQSALGAANATEHARIVNYTLGYDVHNENSDNSVTDTRASIHGDLVHARPLPVNYGGSTGVVAYYGTNDGAFRAVRTSDGVELWSFIAPEHHRSLKRLVDNNPIIHYPHLTDLNLLESTPMPKDYFFDGTAGVYQNADNSQVWVFPTMRRGGRMIYAFDVTNPMAPKLKWRVGCPSLAGEADCTTGYSDIGQTWSTPNVARIKGHEDGASPVIIVGGGYDNCEDQDISAPNCDSAKGRRVYVINAATGTLLKKFETLRSVPADITLMDRNFDGEVDHAYVVDTGGNLYRIDFVDPTTLAPLAASDWRMTRIAQVQAGSARKFLFRPSVAYASGKAYLAFGSGDRERPLIGNYPYVEAILNRYYMFVDNFVAGDPVNLDGDQLADNTTGSVCITASSPLRGWRIDLNAGRGEQTVTSSLIAGGRIFFNTHRATDAPPNQCTADLGEARGYNVDLLCAERFSVVYQGVGLAISPVLGTVTLASGETVTFVIGGASRQNDATGTLSISQFDPGQVDPVIGARRARLYWYRHGDK